MSLLYEWNELLQSRTNLMNGDLEQIDQGGGTVLRGPIVGITVTSDAAADPIQGALEFHLAWVARTPRVGGISTGQWTAESRGLTKIPFTILPGFLWGPHDISDRRVYFGTSTGTRCTIYPSGYPSNLTPDRVQGLKG
jgi:hypothetical protein